MSTASDLSADQFAGASGHPPRKQYPMAPELRELLNKRKLDPEPGPLLLALRGYPRSGKSSIAESLAGEGCEVVGRDLARVVLWNAYGGQPMESEVSQYVRQAAAAGLERGSLVVWDDLHVNPEFLRATLELAHIKGAEARIFDCRKDIDSCFYDNILASKEPGGRFVRPEAFAFYRIAFPMSEWPRQLALSPNLDSYEQMSKHAEAQYARETQLGEKGLLAPSELWRGWMRQFNIEYAENTTPGDAPDAVRLREGFPKFG